MRAKALIIPIMLLTCCFGCLHSGAPGAKEPELPKINARVLVYMPDDFINYNYSYSAILKRYDYYFHDLTIILFPQLVANTFIKADVSYNSKDLNDDHDFVVVPQFLSANFFPDSKSGNDLLIYIQATFSTKDGLKTVVVKGTGKSSDNGIVAQTPDLGRKAFISALNDLKKNIFEQRSFFENH